MIVLRFLFLLMLIGIIAVGVVVFFAWRQMRSGFKRFREEGTERQTHVNGNVIIDRRDPEQVNRKIIPKEEGEYVEFEED